MPRSSSTVVRAWAGRLFPSRRRCRRPSPSAPRRPCRRCRSVRNVWKFRDQLWWLVRVSPWLFRSAPQFPLPRQNHRLRRPHTIWTPEKRQHWRSLSSARLHRFSGAKRPPCRHPAAQNVTAGPCGSGSPTYSHDRPNRKRFRLLVPPFHRPCHRRRYHRCNGQRCQSSLSPHHRGYRSQNYRGRGSHSGSGCAVGLPRSDRRLASNHLSLNQRQFHRVPCPHQPFRSWSNQKLRRHFPNRGDFPGGSACWRGGTADIQSRLNCLRCRSLRYRHQRHRVRRCQRRCRHHPVLCPHQPFRSWSNQLP